MVGEGKRKKRTVSWHGWQGARVPAKPSEYMLPPAAELATHQAKQMHVCYEPLLRGSVHRMTGLKCECTFQCGGSYLRIPTSEASEKRPGKLFFVRMAELGKAASPNDTDAGFL
jgi:hypothetical protein